MSRRLAKRTKQLANQAATETRFWTIEECHAFTQRCEPSEIAWRKSLAGYIEKYGLAQPDNGNGQWFSSYHSLIKNGKAVVMKTNTYGRFVGVGFSSREAAQAVALEIGCGVFSSSYCWPWNLTLDGIKIEIAQLVELPKNGKVYPRDRQRTRLASWYTGEK